MTVVYFFLAFVLSTLFVYVVRYSGRLNFRVERTFPVSPEQLEAAVKTLDGWVVWNPWQEHDPDTKPTIELNALGEGISFSWQSPRSAKIRLSTLKTDVPGMVVQRLEGQSPFSYSGKLVWTITPVENGAKVMVTFKGRIGFAQRALAKTVQSMLSLDFRYALNKLAIYLSPEMTDFERSTYQISYVGVQPIGAHRLLVRKFEGPSKEVGIALQPLLNSLRAEMGCPTSQPGEVLYLQTNLKTGITKSRYGFVGAESMADTEAYDVQAHTAFILQMRGDLRGLDIAWYLAMQQLRSQALQPDQRTPPCERYTLTENAVTPQVDHVELCFPVQIPRPSA